MSVFLIYLYPERQVFGPTEGGIRPEHGPIRVVGDALYANVVTMGTVGFGDRAPNVELAQFMIALQIVASSLFLTFGINVLVGLILENTPASWPTRRMLMKDHIRKVLEQRRRLVGPGVDSTETGPAG
jgi:hypothetical protein